MQDIILWGSADPWLLPALAGAGTALLVLFITVALIQRLTAGRTSSTAGQEEDPEVVHLATHALALGNTDTARFALEKFLAREQPAMPGPWLMLLDIYFARQERRAFETLAKQYSKHTGQPAPDWLGWQSDPKRNSLRDAHPRLMAQIDKLWPRAPALKLLEGVLQQAGRPGRAHFSCHQLQELIELRDRLQRQLIAGSRKPTGPDPQRTQPPPPPPKPELLLEDDDEDPLKDLEQFATKPEPAAERRPRKPARHGPAKRAVTAGANPPEPAPPSTENTGADATPRLTQRADKPQANNDDERSALEINYPRLNKQLSAIWPSIESFEFIDSLIIDDRGGRQGFNADVMEEILFLKEILLEHHPRERDKWESANLS